MADRIRTTALRGLIVAAFVCSVSTSIAQNPPATASRVACIDVVKVFNDYQLQRDLTEELKQIQTRLQSEAQSRQQRADSLKATVEAMDPQDPTYRDRLQELLRMQIDNKVWFETTQATVTRELAVWSNNIYQDIVSIIGDVSRERGYDLVVYKEPYEPGVDPEAVKEQIRRRKLVWSNPNIEITQVVLDRLNAKYNSQPKGQKLRVP